MAYHITYVDKAGAELDKLHEDIVLQAGTRVADSYIDGVLDFIDGLSTFPERGTVREGKIPGLRIIGYRRIVSIAFFVRDDEVVILGVFHRGQNITQDLLEERL